MIDGHDLKGATDVIANVTADNQDISALTLDSEIKKIDLMGKKGVIFNIANVRTGGVNKTIQDTTTGGTFKYKDTPTAIFDAKAYDDILKNQDVEFSAATNMFVLDKTKAVAKSLTYTDVSDRPAQLLTSKALWNDGKRSVVLKAADATVDQYEKLLVEVAKQSGSLAGGVSDSVTALTIGATYRIGNSDVAGPQPLPNSPRMEWCGPIAGAE